jgi:hypothetical protein
MNRCFVGLVLLLPLTAPTSLAAQDPLVAGDSASAALAGQRAGMQQGQKAGVGVAVVGASAATLFVTPFVGGVGSLVAVAFVPGTPRRVPQVGPEAAHPAYQQAYRDAYQEAYLRRLRRSVTGSVLMTSVVWLAIVMGMSG